MRHFLFALLVGCLASFAGASQGQPSKPGIACVWIFKEGPAAPYVESFRSRLREIGWIEGQNIVAVIR